MSYLAPSGLWVMQALNILYVNLGAVLLYKLSQTFQSKTADLVYLFYVSLICYSPYFYSNVRTFRRFL